MQLRLLSVEQEAETGREVRSGGRKEVADAKRQAKDWASEAEKNSGGLSWLQDEVGT